MSLFDAILAGKLNGGGASSWNDLTDKPFGELPTGGDTLTWDGNTEGLESFESMGMVCCLVSDVPENMEDDTDGLTASLVYSDGTTGDLDIGYDTVGNAALNVVFIVQDATGIGGMFPKPGIWFVNMDGFYVTSLTIPGYTGFPSVKKLDAKYLPETSWNDLTDKPFGTTYGDTLIEEQTITLEDMGGVYGAVLNPTGTISEGDYVFVVWNGTETVHKVGIVPGSQGMLYFGNLTAYTPYLFMLSGANALQVASADTQGDVTVCVKKLAISQIKPIYLPVTEFYTNLTDSYLFTDSACSVKATRAELESASSGIVRVSYLDRGASFFPIAMDFSQLTTQGVYGIVTIIQTNGTPLDLYTAEYTG